mmetsp:Transcript_33748/g.67493  ORF Transcript_33748/g.67493 Transcript_33748/m.67493 type:complete len:132 (-) Transcript_33748:310-705(-)
MGRRLLSPWLFACDFTRLFATAPNQRLAMQFMEARHALSLALLPPPSSSSSTYKNRPGPLLHNGLVAVHPPCSLRSNHDRTTGDDFRPRLFQPADSALQPLDFSFEIDDFAVVRFALLRRLFLQLHGAFHA